MESAYMSVNRFISKENVITLVHTHACAHIQTHNFDSSIQKNQFLVFIKMGGKT